MLVSLYVSIWSVYNVYNTSWTLKSISELILEDMEKQGRNVSLKVKSAIKRVAYKWAATENVTSGTAASWGKTRKTHSRNIMIIVYISPKGG